MVEREETFEDIEMLLEEYEEDLGQLTKTNAADPQTNEVVSNSVLNIEAAVDESFISESEGNILFYFLLVFSFTDHLFITCFYLTPI